MEFSDNIHRSELSMVHVFRSQTIQEKEEGYSYYKVPWNESQYLKFRKNLYLIPVSKVQLSENIFNSQGEYVAYRTR